MVVVGLLICDLLPAWPTGGYGVPRAQILVFLLSRRVKTFLRVGASQQTPPPLFPLAPLRPSVRPSVDPAPNPLTQGNSDTPKRLSCSKRVQQCRD